MAKYHVYMQRFAISWSPEVFALAVERITVLASRNTVQMVNKINTAGAQPQNFTNMTVPENAYLEQRNNY